jgi:hypothetical protein
MVLDQAVALSGLSFDLLEPPIANALIQLLREVVTSTLDDGMPNALTWKMGLDAHAQSQYKEAVQELSEMIDNKL